MAISLAESQVMEALWESNPLTAQQVFECLAPTVDWSQATVKTLLNRLLKKQAIHAARDGQKFLYSPLISRDDYLSDQSKGFLDRVFGGDLPAMVSHFSQHEPLSRKDIDALQEIITRLENDD
ncbi:MAG: BlaI/MecI/CopY family transcriptional regulator [Pseudomonadota bacterium]